MIQPAIKSELPPVVHSSTRRTCDELGLCQAQFGKPACPGCDHHDTDLLPKGGYLFAPGVIEGAPNTRAKLVRTGWRTLAKWTYWLLLGFVLAGLAGYAAGHALVWLGVFR